jgi:phytoene dehydrogenase-like protein
MKTITVVGAGIAGVTAAITCAEAGAPVVLFDARDVAGGRARGLDGAYRANLGPHALYSGGPMWRWLHDRSLPLRTETPPLAGIRLRWDGELHRAPPLALIPATLRLRGRRAPVDSSFRAWAARHADPRTAELLSAAAGVYTFHHDPGELSAAFVWERTVRTLLTPPPAARYVVGGWSALVGALETRARSLGVEFRLGERVTDLPAPPVIVATELVDARALLHDDTLRWHSGHTVCIDLALTHRRGDPFIVSDLDECGWVERFTAADRTLTPPGEELVQAQMPVRPGEGPDRAGARLEALLDLAFIDRRARTTWRRRLVMDGRTGALDKPGETWRDRPAVDRGDGVLLAGDCSAAPGLLSEVAWASGQEASRRALELARATRPSLRRVA